MINQTITDGLYQFQAEVALWNYKNFGQQPAYRTLLGAVEEIGELAHAHLKHEQGIRGMTDEEALDAKKDAVGDVMVYLAAYCYYSGIYLADCVEKAWGEVKGRDWTKNKENGK